jgi:hypothetical protein
MALDATRLKNAIKSALDARFGALSGADDTNREGFCEDLATEIVTEVEDNFEGGSGGGVPTSRQVIAGDGLQGGGDLSADRTLNVVAGDTTLTVAANSVVVNTSVVATRAYADSGDSATLASAQTYADNAADAAESAANAYTDASISGLGASGSLGVAGEGLSAGNLVASQNDSGATKLFKTDANHTGALSNPIGIVTSSVSAGATVGYRHDGRVSIDDSLWDSVPAQTDVGKSVFMSETPGKYTITPPTTAGAFVFKVGVLYSGGAGACSISIQFNEIGRRYS